LLVKVARVTSKMLSERADFEALCDAFSDDDGDGLALREVKTLRAAPDQES